MLGRGGEVTVTATVRRRGRALVLRRWGVEVTVAPLRLVRELSESLHLTFYWVGVHGFTNPLRNPAAIGCDDLGSIFELLSRRVRVGLDFPVLPPLKRSSARKIIEDSN